MHQIHKKYISLLVFQKLKMKTVVPGAVGPVPGVIDMFGLSGKLLQHRSALLASRGFAVFCLAYYGYEDIPLSLEGLKLEYFLVHTKCS